MNALKDRMQRGVATRAVWLESASPAMAEAMVYAGCRFVIIDNEHGPASVETTAHLVRAIEAAGGHAMVRVPANDPVLLKRMLEIGVTSIMVPLVGSAAEARAAVAACRYPPEGRRGYSGDIRASRYGMDPRPPREANDRLFLMMQIESPEGVTNAAEIAAVDGVDMLFLGPYDLSGGYGKLGETDCDDVRAAIARLQDVSRQSGCPLGTVPHADRGIRDLIEAGFSLVIAETEISMAMRALREDLSKGDPSWL